MRGVKLVVVRFSLRCKLGHHAWYLDQGAFEVRRCSRCYARDFTHPGDWPTVLGARVEEARHDREVATSPRSRR